MERQAEHRRNTMILSIVAALLVYLGCFYPPLREINYLLSDFFFQHRRQRELSGKIVIVEIDEKTLSALGRFPFDRKHHADLIRNLRRGKPKVIAFDVLFCEPTLSDDSLAAEMRKAGNVVLAVSLLDERLPTDDRISKEMARKGLLSIRNAALKVNRKPDVLLPTPKLAESAYALGFIDLYPDPDSRLRWAPLLVATPKGVVMYIGLAAVATYYGVPPERIRIRHEGVLIGDKFIPTEAVTAFFINYPSVEERKVPTAKEAITIESIPFTFVSYVDVLQGRIQPEEFRDKVVLVGSTAQALKDFRPTPVSVFSTGVEIHAAMINTALTKQFLRTAEVWAELLWVVLWGLLIGYFVPMLHPRQGALLSLWLLAASLGLSFTALELRSLLVNVLPPALACLVSYTAVLVYTLLTERRARQRLYTSLALYVAPTVADQLVKSIDELPEALARGERRDISVLFSDIRGFTSISAKLPAFEVVELLNRYFTMMTDIVFLYDGMVDKFIGDGLMALFGAMPDHEDHAERAVLAGLHMLEELEQIRWEWQQVTGQQLSIGIGINSGEAIVGNFQSRTKQQFTAIGSAVNLAQRLEQMTKEKKVNLLVSEATYHQVQHLVEAHPIYEAIIRGFDQPVTIYEITGLSQEGRQKRRSYWVNEGVRG